MVILVILIILSLCILTRGRVAMVLNSPVYYRYTTDKITKRCLTQMRKNTKKGGIAATLR